MAPLFIFFLCRASISYFFQSILPLGITLTVLIAVFFIQRQSLLLSHVGIDFVSILYSISTLSFMDFALICTLVLHGVTGFSIGAVFIFNIVFLFLIVTGRPAISYRYFYFRHRREVLLGRWEFLVSLLKHFICSKHFLYFVFLFKKLILSMYGVLILNALFVSSERFDVFSVFSIVLFVCVSLDILFYFVRHYYFYALWRRYMK